MLCGTTAFIITAVLTRKVTTTRLLPHVTVSGQISMSQRKRSKNLNTATKPALGKEMLLNLCFDDKWQYLGQGLCITFTKAEG